MPTPPPSSGQGGNSSAPLLPDLTPCALDFAQLLRARQEMEDRVRAYLADLQGQIKTALERRGYQDVSLRLLDGPPPSPDMAGTATLVILARLPLDGLKSPVFKVQVPLAVTYAGELRVQDAQINKFTVPGAFVQPIGTDVAHLADALIQGLSQRYMDHLLQTGPQPSQTVTSDLRRPYTADGE